MAPEVLEQTLSKLDSTGADPHGLVLAGQPGDNEDGVVLTFPDGKALIQTVDFFTPMVNDPRGFGRIAAANALSDVYAMGGEPLSAMNIVCFPAKELPTDILTDILQGGLEVVLESGAVPAGGHSVEDDEIKYGLAVSGTVDPQRMSTNRGMRPGDLLLLTKPIGTGVLATALKAEWDGHQGFEAELIRWCGRLNNAAGRIIRELGILGATDITGFGLGGHLLELCSASHCGAEIWLSQVPFFDQAVELAGMGLLPAGSICNRNFYRSRCTVEDGIDPLRFDLCFDAQTSGGLLLCVPEDTVNQAISLLHEAGEMAEIVGRATEQSQAKPLHILAHRPA